MKRIHFPLPHLLGISSLLLLSAPGQSAILWQSGWENTNGTVSTCVGDPNDPLTDNFAWQEFGPGNNAVCSATPDIASLSTTQVHSGTKSLQVHFKDNDGNQGPDFRIIRNIGSNRTDTYFRYYVYYSPEWVWSMSDHKQSILGAGNQGTQDVYFNIRRGANNRTGRLVIAVLPPDCVFGDSVNGIIVPGRWHLVEGHIVSGANGRIEARLDGVPLSLVNEAGTCSMTNPNNTNTGTGIGFLKLDTTYNCYQPTSLNCSPTDNFMVNNVEGFADVYFDDVALCDTTWCGPVGGTTDTTPPSVPTNLSASAVSSTQINLSWTAATDNVGVTGYRIFRGGSQIATATGTTYSNTGLSPSTLYTYTVAAYDAATNVSAQSTPASATTLAGAPTPTVTLTANPTTVTSGSNSTLNWTSTNATACSASNGWSGAKATSGSQSVGPLSATASFALTCSGTGGVAAATATVTVSGTGTGGVFFNEGWESGTMNQSFNSNFFGTFGNQFSVQTTQVGSGTRSLQHTLPAGSNGDNNQYGTQHFGDSPATPVWPTGIGNHYPDLYLQYKVRYAPGFNFSVGNNKMLVMGTQDTHDQSAICCDPWAANYVTMAAGSNGAFQAEGNNKQGANNQWIELSPNMNGYSRPNGVFYMIQTGRWYTIEVRRRLNDSGQDNGIFQMWIDGVQQANYTNIRYRVPWNGTVGVDMTLGTNWIQLSDYVNTAPSQSQSIFYDDVKLSTSYIGTGVPPANRCDVSGNGTTDVSDVQQCSNQAIGVVACSTGDINQDSQCNVIDVQRVVNAALGGQCVTP